MPSDLWALRASDSATWLCYFPPNQLESDDDSSDESDNNSSEVTILFARHHRGADTDTATFYIKANPATTDECSADE